MKVLPKKLLPLILFGIAVTSFFSARPVQAFTITLEQIGSNVVANGSGAINLTGLTFAGGAAIGGGGIQASAGQMITGSPGSARAYTGLNGPTSFGSGGLFDASTSSERSQYFIGAHDETLSVTMSVHNPDCSLFAIDS